MSQLRLVVILAIFFNILPLCADPPGRFNYQARLTDSGNNPLNGSHTLFFSIYQGGTSGSAGSGLLVYKESKGSLISDGLVSHEVGSGTVLFGNALSAKTFNFDGDTFLEVAVDNQANVILPRSRFDSVPYSFQSDESKRITHNFIVADNSNPIAAGQPVSFSGGKVGRFIGSLGGAKYTFNNAPTSRCAVASVPSNQFVVAYIDEGNGNALTAIVGTFTNGIISYGPESPVGSAATRLAMYYNSSYGVVMIAYSTGTQCFVVAGKFSGAGIKFGLPVPFSASDSSDMDINAGMIAFVDNGDSFRGKALIANVSGTTVTVGPAYPFSSGAASSPRVGSLPQSKRVLAFCDSTLGGAACFADVSGTSITIWPQTFFNYGVTSQIAFSNAVYFSPTLTGIDIAFVDDAHGSAGRVASGGANPVAKTFGFAAPYAFNNGVTSDISADNSIITYHDASDPNRGKYIFYLGGGNFSESATFSASATSFHSINGGFLAFRDIGAGNIGNVVTIGESNYSPGFAGVAQVAAGPSATLPVIVGGVANVYSGLTAGARYYYSFFNNPDGFMTTSTLSGIVLGRAVSSTEILLDSNLQAN